LRARGYSYKDECCTELVYWELLSREEADVFAEDAFHWEVEFASSTPRRTKRRC
jgi:hypothetical protein